MFQIGDIVKTYKIRGTAKYFGVIIRILNKEQSAYPYEIKWLNAKPSEYPVAYFKDENLRKVS